MGLKTLIIVLLCVFAVEAFPGKRKTELQESTHVTGPLQALIVIGLLTVESLVIPILEAIKGLFFSAGHGIINFFLLPVNIISFIISLPKTIVRLPITLVTLPAEISKKIAKLISTGTNPVLIVFRYILKLVSFLFGVPIPVFKMTFVY